MGRLSIYTQTHFWERKWGPKNGNFMTWIHFRKEFLYKNTGSNRVKYEMISSNHMCRDFRLLHIYMPRQHCKVFARRRRSKRYNGHAYTLGCIILWTIASLWGKATLNTGSIGGAGACQNTCKKRTFLSCSWHWPNRFPEFSNQNGLRDKLHLIGNCCFLGGTVSVKGIYLTSWWARPSHTTCN